MKAYQPSLQPVLDETLRRMREMPESQHARHDYKCYIHVEEPNTPCYCMTGVTLEILDEIGVTTMGGLSIWTRYTFGVYLVPVYGPDYRMVIKANDATRATFKELADLYEESKNTQEFLTRAIDETGWFSRG